MSDRSRTLTGILLVAASGLAFGLLSIFNRQAAALGLVWIVGRILYLRAYMRDPKTRAMGAMTTGLASVALLALAIAGVLRAGMGWA